jgi:hypothetical protein
MQWVETTKQILSKRISVKSLGDIVKLAQRGVQSGSMVLPAFVIRQIAQSVYDSWDGRVVQQPETHLVEKGLRPAFDALLDAMLADAPKNEIDDLLVALIRAWELIQAELEEIARFDN